MENPGPCPVCHVGHWRIVMMMMMMMIKKDGASLSQPYVPCLTLEKSDDDDEDDDECD